MSNILINQHGIDPFIHAHMFIPQLSMIIT